MSETRKFVELEDLKDPTIWGCCLIPLLMVVVVIAGLFYRFCCWAFM